MLNSTPYPTPPPALTIANVHAPLYSQLPSMKQRLPHGWIGVHDHLRSLLSVTKHISRTELLSVAKRHGLPHQPKLIPFEREVDLMLAHLHALGAIMWFDVPGLRELVVIEPQWVLDGMSRVIRNFEIHHLPVDAVAVRKADKQWAELKSRGRLHDSLLDHLWGDADYKDQKATLLRLMEHFSLIVPVPSEIGLHIVPALLSQDAPVPSFASGAPCILLHFGFDGQQPSGELIWDEEAMADGFLPEGAFHDLCGSLVGWSHHTSKGFKAVMGCSNAFVAFGSHRIVLDHSEGSPYVSCTVDAVAGVPAGELMPIAIRLGIIANRMLRRFRNLRCRLLLPLAATAPPIAVDYQLLGNENDTTTVYIGNKPRPASELKQRLGAWLRPSEPPASVDVFFSYGHISEDDARFIQQVHDCTVGNGIVAFLDQHSLRSGEALDYSCLLGLANSKLLVPLVSWPALRRLSTLTATSECNYLLLEWTFMVLLEQLFGAVICPIFIGARDGDGTSDPTLDLFKAKPPHASDDGVSNDTDADGVPRCAHARACVRE